MTVLESIKNLVELRLRFLFGQKVWEEDSAVNGLQLAVAILLCSHSPALEWRLSRRVALALVLRPSSLSASCKN
eukprot:3024355-Amphidinium_carterae.1